MASLLLFWRGFVPRPVVIVPGGTTSAVGSSVPLEAATVEPRSVGETLMLSGAAPVGMMGPYELAAVEPKHVAEEV